MPTSTTTGSATPSPTAEDSRRAWAWRSALPLVALAFCYASLAQGVGWNQNAHYALVRALADGSAVVDAYRDETGDVAWVDGHYYAAKAPGLAFATVPLYVVLDALGIKELMARAPGATDETVGMLWALGLVGCVLAAVGIALLVRRLGDLVAPGGGLPAAVTLGLGTLLLPFTTLFFSHVLAAALAFTAFAALWLRPRWAAASGVLAGLAVTVDYPLALAALMLAFYAATRGLGRVLQYAAGALAGVAPLLAYQWWAFGSPFHLAYENAVLVGGESGHDVLGANAAGFFGIQTPSFETAVELLFAPIGLLRLSPVLAAAAVGVALVWRRGFRVEAAVIAALALSYLVYNAGYYQPFGGFVPGPRFLVPILPFLGVGLAAAYRRFPLTTALLGLGSIALVAAVTATGPLLAFDTRWDERLLEGAFAGRSWPAVVPFGLLLFVTVVLTARAATLDFALREIVVTAIALAGWAVTALAGPRLLGDSDLEAALVVTVIAAVSVAAAVAAAWGVRLAQPDGG